MNNDSQHTKLIRLLNILIDLKQWESEFSKLNTPYDKNHDYTHIKKTIDKILHELTSCQALIETTKENIKNKKAFKKLDHSHFYKKDVITSQLKLIWCEILSIDTIQMNKCFFKIGGGTTLTALALIKAIKSKYHKKINLKWLFKHNTIQKQAHYLLQNKPIKSKIQTCAPYISVNKKAKSPHLFLVQPPHYDEPSYTKIINHIPSSQACTTFLPNDLKKNINSIPDIAELYLEQMLLIQPKGPFYLCGFISGGIIAYEMASQLEQSGMAVKGLYLIDSYLLSPKQKLQLNKLKSLFLIILEKNQSYLTLLPEQRSRLLRIGENLIDAMIHYKPELYRQPCTLIKATQLPQNEHFSFFSERKIKAYHEFIDNLVTQTDNGWGSVINQLHVHQYDCNHNQLSQETNISSILKFITNDIAKKS